MTFPNQLIPEFLQRLIPYQSARRLFKGGRVFLNANESPYTHDYSLDCSRLNRYPDCQPDELVDAYATYATVDRSQVLVSRGADEGIELLIRTFCQPGEDSITISTPTYGMYAISAQTHNIAAIDVPLREDFQLDVDRLCQTSSKLLFICRPNNPTGTLVSRNDIITIATALADRCLVVVDEAYIEFCADQQVTDLLAQHPNLVILRTLSKAFALAGLRTGFVLAQASVIQQLLKVIAPYPIALPTAQIATAAMAGPQIERMRTEVDSLQLAVRQVAERLDSIPGIQRVGDSCANFLLFYCEQAQHIMHQLQQQHILIRDQSKQRGLRHCLRFTVGTPEQNEQALVAITEALAAIQHATGQMDIRNQ